jgi:hypothetical protein
MSYQLLMWSGAISIILITLFLIEEHRTRRFGEDMRAVFDRMLVRVRHSIRSAFPEVNGNFFQELFYFTVHKTLSGILISLRAVERLIVRVARFNRKQVHRLRVSARKEHEIPTQLFPTEHARRLSEIIEHKRSVELTPAERAHRKEASIEGRSLF